MPETDVIFNIGAEGTESTAAGIKKIVNSLNKLRVKIMEAVNSAQAYQQVVKRLEVDMRSFNATTEGQIDTLESYRGANRLTQTGLKLTARQIEAIGKAAISHNKALGDGPEGATRQYNKLISGIVRARESALIPLGIDLSQTTDKAKAQKEAVEKLTEKYGDYEVKLETTAERMFSLQNTLGTVKDQLAVAAWDRFSAGASESGNKLWDLVKGLEVFSTDMKDTNGRMAEWIVTNEGLEHSFNVLINTIGATITPLEKFDDNLEILSNRYKDLAFNMKTVATMTRQLDFDKLATGLGYAPKGRIKDIEPTRKGGKKKKKVSDFIITEEEAELGLSQEELDFWRKNAELTQEQVEAEFFAAFSEGEVTLEDPIMALHMQRFQAESDAAFAHAQLMEDLERAQTERHAQEIQSRIDAVMNSAQATSGIMANLQKTMNKNSQAGFNAAKGLAIAQVAVDTPAAAMAAYKSVVGIPYVGPFLAVAAASAAVAAGVAQIANIKKQKFSPSGAGASAPSASAISAPSINASANQYGAGATQQESTTIINNVLVDGQVIHSSMINANNDASQRGEQSFATAV